MPCDTRLKPRQTISERKQEVLAVVERLSKALVSGKVTAKVGPQGAIAFAGLTEAERDGVTDACMYRRMMSSTAVSALAKQAIAKAEMLAGRKIDQKAVAVGVHSHDQGKTWHDHRG